MKLTKLALAVGALALSGAAAAEFSANIGATNNYIWRGVSQTSNGAAVSGGLDYAHDSGFYAGTWASNIDWTGGTAGSGAEVDFYGGFASEVSGLGYDVGAIYYYYPTSGYDDSNFGEIYGTLSWGPVSGGIAYTVTSDVNDVSGTAQGFQDGDLYYHVSANFEVMPTWTVGGTIGYYDFEDNGDGGTDINYTHYQVDVGKSAGDFGDFTFTVSKAEEESGSDDTLFVVSWAKTF